MTKRLLFLVLIVFYFGVIDVIAQGTGNHTTMSLQNCRQISDTIFFDLFLKSDGAITSNLRLNSCSFGINFNSAILANPLDTFKVSYVSGTSDVLPTLNGFTVIAPSSNYPYHIRISESAWTGGNQWGLGLVNTADTVVTLVALDSFICSGCVRHSGNDPWNGNPIFINGIQYTVSQVVDDTHLWLSTSAGTQTNVTYSVNSPYSINPMIVGHDYRVGTFYFVDTKNNRTQTVPFVSGTSPNFTLQDVSVGGKTPTVPVLYLDGLSSTTSVAFNGASDSTDGHRSVRVDCNLTITSTSNPNSKDENTIKLYPNPSKSQFTIQGLSLNTSATVDIYDVLGKKVYSQVISNHNQPTINFHASPGIYMVQINTGDKQFLKKLVVE